MNLDNFFKPKTVAVIGASRDESKIGHVIFKNIIDAGFEGEVIPINPKAHNVLKFRAYPSISKVKKRINLAIIAIPQPFVMGALKECKKKGIRDILLITAGYSEIGNHKEEKELKNFIEKNNMNMIGPNCLGTFDAYNKMDNLFLPQKKLKRPKEGSISFICQSGAVGSAILDLATGKDHKFSKFVSYGNATNLTETDLIEYLAKDKNTKVICAYVEGFKDGSRFFEVAKKVSKIKPIVLLKGGLTELGAKAALSHTGTLAGKKEVYFGVFKQAGVIKVDSLEEMFETAQLVEEKIKLNQARLQVITNGGGYGIIATDNISNAKNISMAKMSKSTEKTLRKKFPKTVNIGNPLDLVGDAQADRYEYAIKKCIKDKNIDSLLLIVLIQTPIITDEIEKVIVKYKKLTKKPIITVSTGSETVEHFLEELSHEGLTTFEFPENAIRAVNNLAWYEKKKKSL